MDTLKVTKQSLNKDDGGGYEKVRDYIYVIISDIHLGSPLLKVDLLVDFLRQLLKKGSLKTLIINGDFIDNSNFRWPNKHWQVIGLLDQLQQAGVDIRYVIGNHDKLITNNKSLCESILSRLFNYLTCTNYSWIYKNQLFFVIHGDNWDPNCYLRNTYSKPLFKIVSCIHNWLCKLSPKLGRLIPYKVKFIRTGINEVVNSVYEKSLEYAITNNSHIFTGHTHQPILTKVNSHIIGNSGSWTSEIPTFIGIIDNHVLLNKYTESGEQTQQLCIISEVKENLTQERS